MPDGDDVEPGIRAFIDKTLRDTARLSGGEPPTLADRRQIAEEVRAQWRTGGPAMASTEETRMDPGGVRLRVHRPTDEDGLPTLAYCHGGGWTLFSLDTHDRLMREYAARAGCVVVGIEYSLSPEARFPRARDEVVDALGWIHDQGAGPLAVGGDSAGGNLALAAAIVLRDRGQELLSGVLVSYGALDDAPRPSYTRYGGERYMLAPAEMAAYWANYLGEDPNEPAARPLNVELAGLPPTFVCIAECDILADENRELVRRLAAAGVKVESRSYPGATHSFLEAAAVSPLARQALDDAAGWLRGVLGG